ncbi:hypothetical protein [Gimesia aquarii]|uniref:Uncharacterized protein n=1 Tax=Gimesia aquarii TaxID=2527964 RepID=A0A517X332_9PLAN|nr:hypothetical protein [Gimesia aquarii]QDU11917.1 hypothetical protein V202x_53420 [Gimesia aquarii]
MCCSVLHRSLLSFWFTDCDLISNHHHKWREWVKQITYARYCLDIGKFCPETHRFLNEIRLIGFKTNVIKGNVFEMYRSKLSKTRDFYGDNIRRGEDMHSKKMSASRARRRSQSFASSAVVSS